MPLKTFSGEEAHKETRGHIWYELLKNESKQYAELETGSNKLFYFF